MGLFDLFKKKATAAEETQEAPVLPRNPKLGLVVELPIAVADVQTYLASLKSAAGDALTWEPCESVNGISVYRSSFASGVPYQTVYLEVNAKKNPSQLPLGFIQ